MLNHLTSVAETTLKFRSDEVQSRKYKRPNY